MIPSARRVETSVSLAPSFTGILRRGLPGFLREGFLPLGAFYAAYRFSGLGIAIVAATAVALIIYIHERRVGRDGLQVRLALVFIAVQAVVGLLSDSAIAYLALPVLANAIWGAAFFVSVFLRRPLVGALALAWYPFPPGYRDTHEFKRVFGIESIAWGCYLLARSAIRLALLLHGDIGSYVVVVFVTGIPLTLGLLAWSIWYALRKLPVPEEPA